MSRRQRSRSEPGIAEARRRAASSGVSSARVTTCFGQWAQKRCVSFRDIASHSASQGCLMGRVLGIG